MTSPSFLFEGQEKKEKKKKKKVQLHECSPFWIGIFIFKKKALPCLLFDVDMHILIDKALKHFYML